MKEKLKNKKGLLHQSPLKRFLSSRSPFGGLSVRGSLILGALISGFVLVVSLLGFYFFSHSYWLLWFSVASFIGVSWTVWIEFAPRTMKERLECKAFSGIRFKGGIGAAFNLIVLFFVVWYFKGSLPFAPEDNIKVIGLLVLMMMFYPLTVWASGKRTFPAV